MVRVFRNTVFSICLLVAGLAFGQDPQATLFSVDNAQVSVEEFDYIYNKNNRDNADYSLNSLMEYLDLYTKFKLKVARARELQLDTITSLKNELAGYRSQLAKSYLNDKEVKEKLAREAYERMQTDVRISHILISVEENASDETEKQAWQRANGIVERVNAGEAFADLALELSNDTNSGMRGGDLGFLAATFPNGFYQMESAAYNLEIGEVSQPVRSILGYHVLQLNERRPARGQIEAAHILVRVKQDGTNAQSAKQKIDAIMRNLQAGKEFEAMARTLSDDEPSGRRGGYIGKIGINMYDSEFEDAAFGIEEIGGYSKPVRTRLGWHVIKLLKKVKLKAFDEERRTIEARLSRDERIDIATEAMISSIKKESGFVYDQGVLDELTGPLESDFLSFQWKVPQLDVRPLITFKNGLAFTNADYAMYLKANTRQRMRAQKDTPPQQVALELFDAFVDDKCLEYEESQLDLKHPEFAALMREYEEGILLFEVTKMKVWDPASSDTVGLRAFHNGHRENYMWPERAEVHEFKVNSTVPKVVEKAHKLVGKLPTAKAVKKMNKKETVLTYESKKYTQEESFQRGLRWTGETLTPLVVREEEGHASFSKVVTITPETPKRLEEARGYIIADYQDQLEREWIESLRARYRVDVNEPVLKSLVRK